MPAAPGGARLARGRAKVLLAHRAPRPPLPGRRQQNPRSGQPTFRAHPPASTHRQSTRLHHRLATLTQRQTTPFARQPHAGGGERRVLARGGRALLSSRSSTAAVGSCWSSKASVSASARRLALSAERSRPERPAPSHGWQRSVGSRATTCPGIIAAMAAESADDLLRDGREALAAADWEHARGCFEKAAELGESAEVLDGLSQALHFQGESRGRSSSRSGHSPPTGAAASAWRPPSWRAGWRSCTARSTATWPPRTGGWRGRRACSRG